MSSTPLAHAPYFPEMRDFQHFRDTHNRYAYRTQANLVPTRREWLLKAILVRNQVRYHGFNLAEPLPYLMATEPPAEDNIPNAAAQEVSHKCDIYSSMKAIEDAGKTAWADLDDDEDDVEVPPAAPSAILPPAERESGIAPSENPLKCTIYSSLAAVEAAGKSSWADLDDEDDAFEVPSPAQSVPLTAEPAVKPVSCEILDGCKIYSALAALKDSGKDCWADMDDEDDLVELIDPCHPTPPVEPKSMPVEPKSMPVAQDTPKQCDIYCSLKAVEAANKESWADLDDNDDFEVKIPSGSTSPGQDFSPPGEEALSPISSVSDGSELEEHVASAADAKEVLPNSHEPEEADLPPVGEHKEDLDDTTASHTGDDEQPSPFTFTYIANLSRAGGLKDNLGDNAALVKDDDDQPSPFTFTFLANQYAANCHNKSTNDAAASKMSPPDKTSTPQPQPSPVPELEYSQEVEAHTQQTNPPISTETEEVGSCELTQPTAPFPVINAPKKRNKTRNDQRKESRRASKEIEARVWVAIAELQAADVVYTDTKGFITNGLELPDMEAFQLSVPPTEAELRVAQVAEKKAAKKARQKVTRKAKKKQKGFGWMLS